MPTIYALDRARRYLEARGIKDVTLIVTGGLRVSSDFAKALALGADAVAIGTAALMAIGCQQYRICDTGRCPVGIATQDPGLRARLDVDEAARGLANFLRVSTEELKDFARLTGNDSVHKLSVRDLVTTSSEISEFTVDRTRLNRRDGPASFGQVETSELSAVHLDQDQPSERLRTSGCCILLRRSRLPESTDRHLRRCRR